MPTDTKSDEVEPSEKDDDREEPIRAARYRALALTEKYQARANLLDRLADEAERGVLCAVRHLRLVHVEETAPAAVAA